MSLKLKKTISNITEDLKKIADRKRPVCKSFKSTYSIGASASIAVDIPITIPAGYEFCMATIESTGKAGVLARDCFLTGTKTVRLYVDNVKATEQTGCEARVNVLFMPENSSGGVLSLIFHITGLKNTSRRRWQHAELEDFVEKEPCSINDAKRNNHISIPDGLYTLSKGWKYRYLLVAERFHISYKTTVCKYCNSSGRVQTDWRDNSRLSKQGTKRYSYKHSSKWEYACLPILVNRHHKEYKRGVLCSMVNGMTNVLVSKRGWAA